MAKKVGTAFICQTCSYQTSKWMGKCPECGEWNTFEEEKNISLKPSSRLHRRAISSEKPQIINEIQIWQDQRILSGIREFDRVLGGGITRGSLILVGGEPGIGKSTLIAEVLGKLANIQQDSNVLYVSGEESSSQVADRLRRLGVSGDNFYIFHETNWQDIQDQLASLRPAYLVIDSIQTTNSSEVPALPGTVSQIREVTYELMNYAKANNITCFIIGHITKDGVIAGPKILEHMVDTVIYFEGDPLGHYRILRAIKNRYGNTNEVGIFEMREDGLKEVDNPSQYFLDDGLQDSYGRSLTCIIEGSRPLFVEIQALVVENKFGNGRRTTQGLDTNRLAMLVAIVEKYFKIPLGFNDIYLNAVGGIKLKTRESDLSIIASLLSSYRTAPISNDTIFLGEVGLTGEVRSVARMESRLNEIVQHNYKRVITSEKIAKEYQQKYSLELIGIKKACDLENIL